jgi:hypothetical protein
VQEYACLQAISTYQGSAMLFPSSNSTTTKSLKFPLQKGWSGAKKSMAATLQYNNY